jgi:4-hydroxy-3-methylbut-2-en-1-yl diphosphate reductase
MKVLKTKNIGFCFGVKRAVKMVHKEAASTKDTIYTMGPIIHNPLMVNILKEKEVVFRTHGIRKD